MATIISVSDNLFESEEALDKVLKERTFYSDEQKQMYETLRRQVEKAMNYANLIVEREKQKGW